MRTTAFLVVDMQNDFVRSNAPLGVPDALGTVDLINRVGREFRLRNRPVVFTRFVAGGCTRYYEDIKAERETVAIIDELEKEKQDIEVDKYWYGAFHRTNLEDILGSYGVDTVVVSGTVTQICVEETARQAFHHGYKTIILSDCVSSFDQQLHDATLKNLSMKFGAVMSSSDFLKLLD